MLSREERNYLALIAHQAYLQEYLSHCSPGSFLLIKACFPVSVGQDHLQKVLLTFCFLGLKTPCQRLLNLLFSDAFEDGFAVERFCFPLEALSEGWQGKCRLALCHWWLCHQTKCILKGKFPRERHFILHSFPFQPNMSAAGILLLAIDVWPLSGETWQLLETASGSILGKEHFSDVCGNLFYNGMGVRSAHAYRQEHAGLLLEVIHTEMERGAFEQPLL